MKGHSGYTPTDVCGYAGADLIWIGTPPSAPDRSTAKQTSWVLTASRRLAWLSTSFRTQSRKWSIYPWNGWWATAPLLGKTVGKVTQSLTPGSLRL